jgi:hypothetical protein
MGRHTLQTEIAADGTILTSYEAESGTRGAPSGLRWYVCRICHQDTREDSVQLIGGAPYCTLNGCAEEKQDEIDGRK